jgi:hypothetical protein
MNVVEKVKELSGELKNLKKEFKVDMFEYVQQEFRKRGFVSNPRGKGFEQSLYNPETNINVHIANITNNSVIINVIDVVNDGMNWGKAYHKLPNGTDIRFNFLKQDFDKFYDTTYINRVNKLNELLVD